MHVYAILDSFWRVLLNSQQLVRSLAKVTARVDAGRVTDDGELQRNPSDANKPRDDAARLSKTHNLLARMTLRSHCCLLHLQAVPQGQSSWTLVLLL